MGTGDALMTQDSQGWSYAVEDVCATCVDEPALSAIVAAHAHEDVECSFCATAPAASLDVLLEAFMQGLRREFDRAIDVLFIADDFTARYDSAELVRAYESVFVGDGLLDAVLEYVKDDEWVARDFAVLHHGDAMGLAWEAFCHKVKFETRYVMWLQKPKAWEGQGGEVAVADVLMQLAHIVEAYGLIKPMPALTTWWRAQSHGPDPIEHTPGRLGTVPSHLAVTPNRMSPAGIPMFYGSTDPVTAVAEVAGTPSTSAPAATADHGPVSPAGEDPGPGPNGEPDAHATVGAFQTSRDCLVVDFTNLPPIVSIFDPEHGDQVFSLRFLHRFVAQLSSKADPDWVAVDYVPTQVLTEFFLHVHDAAGAPIEGLVYRSAITGEPSIVMAVPNERCVDQNEEWHNLTHHTAAGADAAASAVSPAGTPIAGKHVGAAPMPQLLGLDATSISTDAIEVWLAGS